MGSSTRDAARVCLARVVFGLPLVGVRPCFAGAVTVLGGVVALLRLILVRRPALCSGRGRCVIVALAVSHGSEVS